MGIRVANKGIGADGRAGVGEEIIGVDAPNGVKGAATGWG